MRRVIVTLVSVGLIAGLVALVPLLSGEPASAATPCVVQHRHLAQVQKRVKGDQSRIRKDRRHHRRAVLKRDVKKLAKARRRMRSAQMAYRLCLANHRPGKTVTVSPSTSSTPSPTGAFPTDPAALCSMLTLPSDCMSSVPTPTSTPTVMPTDPVEVCDLLGLGTVCSSITPQPTTEPTTGPSSVAPTQTPAALPDWLTALYPSGVPDQVVSALDARYGSLPATQPADLCSALSGLSSTLLPSLCLSAPGLPGLSMLG